MAFPRNTVKIQDFLIKKDFFMSNKLKKKIPNIIFGLIFLVGICVILYPSVSNYINSKHQSKAVASYEDAIMAMDTVDYDQIWQKAYEYNEAL